MSEAETETSSDGRFAVTYRMSERMNGQWAATPTVRDCHSGAVIVALADDNLDGAVRWGEGAGRFSLALRCWPGVSPGVSAYFDVDGGTVRLGELGETRPLAEAAALIAAHFAAQQAAAPPAPPPAPKVSAARKLAEGAGIALFIAAGIAAAMGWLG